MASRWKMATSCNLLLFSVGVCLFVYLNHIGNLRVLSSKRPSVSSLDDLTLAQVIEYVERTNASSCRLVHDLGGHLHHLGVDGQKAVCLDQDIRPESDNCLVYSFGIAYDWSFDEAMETLGCERNHNHSEKIHFYQMGLAGRDERWTHYPGANWTVRSLDSIYKMLDHQDRIIDYLKIDIEDSEWQVLPQILSSGMMDRVRQLAVEVHFPNDGELDEFRWRVGVLRLLDDYGLVRFDSKKNPWSVDFNSIVNYEGPLAYELVWLNPKLRRNL